MRGTWWWVVMAGVLALSPACSQAAGPLEPLVVGWERIFKLDWEAAQAGGRPVVRGYVANDSPYSVTRIQLLVEALDESGRVLGQRVGWVPGAMAGFDRRYFELPAPQPAPAYRVRVFAFDRIESPSLLEN